MNSFEIIFYLLDFKSAFSALAAVSMALIFILTVIFFNCYYDDKIKSFILWLFGICTITFILSLFVINLLPEKKDIDQFIKLNKIESNVRINQ